ncbi:hypothetical protein MJ1_0242 [Nanobdella aerobiophila]|uniref:Uncharacterized protein n=1 Tax=Nanobdella aerobiophila TaxID=2586965 RepID=A0A915SK37_9ARCH|nr:hypothetical protein [Nanobdella aerobiophila]BBL45413.1 hypothetical protein MJ1_0242 [Nanobdella aerobiophila]
MIDKNNILSILNISKNKLDDLIKEKYKQYNNLIDEDTAILLILKDYGLSLEDIYNIKLKNIYQNIKINQIKLKINKILYKDQEKIILEVGDETGLVKLLLKDPRWKEISYILKENNSILVKRPVILNNYFITLYINNIYNIKKIEEDIEIKNKYYLSIRYIKLLKKDDDKYIVLTDNFTILYIDKKYEIDKDKTYIIKFYNKKPLEIIELKTY